MKHEVRCPKCRYPLPSGWTTCPECGLTLELSWSGRRRFVRARRHQRLAWIIAGVATALISLALGVFVSAFSGGTWLLVSGLLAALILVVGVVGAACAIFVNRVCRRGLLSARPAIRGWSAVVCVAWPMIVLMFAILGLAVHWFS